MALISDNPFLKDLGFELLDMKDGIAEVGINLQAQHMNSWQVMHGGIIMTLLDAVMARAARSLVPDLTSAATVEMKTSFFQPGGKISQQIIGRGKVLHRSTTMYYCEGEIWNGEAFECRELKCDRKTGCNDNPELIENIIKKGNPEKDFPFF